MIAVLPKKGHLLVAEPSTLGDVSFNRSVVFLAEHNAEGSVGFIMNKPLSYTIEDLVPEIEASFVVYNGGPVEQDNLYFIHNTPKLIPNSVEIADGIFWGGDFEMVISMLKKGTLDLGKIRFYLGYSGWGNGQLTDEMKEKSWLTANATRKLVFQTEIDHIWKESVRSMGGEFEQLIHYPIDPQLN